MRRRQLLQGGALVGLAACRPTSLPPARRGGPAAPPAASTSAPPEPPAEAEADPTPAPEPLANLFAALGNGFEPGRTYGVTGTIGSAFPHLVRQLAVLYARREERVLYGCSDHFPGAHERWQVEQHGAASPLLELHGPHPLFAPREARYALVVVDWLDVSRASVDEVKAQASQRSAAALVGRTGAAEPPSSRGGFDVLVWLDRPEHRAYLASPLDPAKDRYPEMNAVAPPERAQALVITADARVKIDLHYDPTTQAFAET